MKNTVFLPLTQNWSEEFARKWLDAWNGHDADLILSFYADSVVLVSPVINKALGHEDGILLTKIDLKEYCKKIFNDIPELRLKLMTVAVGVEHITIHYSSPEFHLSADVVYFDSEWKIGKTIAYY